ncbi:MAG: ATP-binding protein [Myxococcaceae bacterium]|nr:ATP-binding protein [Myxococcaceae bacterium]MCI0672726.1 ATP-binding protein [Myxococcaceae bacterium]
MKWRIASLAFLIGILCTGIAWLSMQPALLRLLQGLSRLAPPGSPEALLRVQVQALLPLWLGLALVTAVLLTFCVLYVIVGRPLRETEGLAERVGRQPEGQLASLASGPLLRRVHVALERTSRELAEERARTHAQLVALQDANERLARAQTELVSAEHLATVGRLAAGVAHEVGNPLGGILGYLSLLQSRAGADTGMLEHLERIEEEVRRIDGIVRGLLDLGRPRTGQPVPVMLQAQVEATVRLVAAGADFAGVEVVTDIPRDLVVRCEQGALSQILINLLINAASAVEGKGRVRVSASSEDGRVELSVEDSGPGILPEVLPRVFEPFFTTKPAGKGTGLGLAIAQHLAAQQGGSLSAGNRPEGGARFCLALPVA